MAADLNYITRDAIEAAIGEYVRLGQELFLEKYGFGRAVRYVVQDPLTKIWMDSKAVVGAAYGYRFPGRGALSSRDFSGGEVQVVRLLRELNFDVTSLENLDGQPNNRDWSHLEVELVVADYLEMLKLELAGQKYSKAARRRALIPLLNSRSNGSIEFKHQNISSALLEFGYPPIRGYLPAANRQAILLEIVERQLAENRELDSLAQAFIDTPAVVVQPTHFDTARVAPPKPRERNVREAPASVFRPVKRDYLEREARNSSLGKAGELFILQYEQWRLASAGLGQLADKVRHVSVEDGDGLGYDVLSFRENGTPQFIEVKTTAFGERTPFFVTSGELKFAKAEVDRFALFRLFDFKSTPQFFELNGPIEMNCSLDPTTYRATLF